MNDELYKALSKGYADEVEQLNALELIETQQNSIMHRNDLLAELARNVEGRQERIDTLEAEVARLKAALRTMVYEATHLSQEEDDLSHWCKFTGDALQAARAALTHGENNR
jgi:uncharacterized protein YoxC